MMHVQTAPLSLLMLIAYPAVFQLHASGWGDRGADGAMVLPPTVPASSQYLEQHGAYLVDCGHICFVWVGQLVTPELVRVRLPKNLLFCSWQWFSKHQRTCIVVLFLFCDTYVLARESRVLEGQLWYSRFWWVLGSRSTGYWDLGTNINVLLRVEAHSLHVARRG